jgi:predicted regulator of Ras-like GTPase activity (Roadblock/LC7/MglB family)
MTTTTEQATQIDDILASILNVDGIAGAMVFDPEGALLGAQMPAVYSDDMLHEVADQVVSTLLTLKEMKIRVDDVSYTFEELRLVVCDLRKKGFLCILSQTTIGPALLNITTNVAQKKLALILDGKAVTATRSLRTSRPIAPASGTTAQPPASSGISQTANPASPSTSFESSSVVTDVAARSTTSSSTPTFPAASFQPTADMDRCRWSATGSS